MCRGRARETATRRCAVAGAGWARCRAAHGTRTRGAQAHTLTVTHHRQTSDETVLLTVFTIRTRSSSRAKAEKRRIVVCTTSGLVSASVSLKREAKLKVTMMGHGPWTCSLFGSCNFSRER